MLVDFGDHLVVGGFGVGGLVDCPTRVNHRYPALGQTKYIVDSRSSSGVKSLFFIVLAPKAV
jgi:hypothetical protein